MRESKEKTHIDIQTQKELFHKKTLRWQWKELSVDRFIQVDLRKDNTLKKERNTELTEKGMQHFPVTL